MVESPAVTYSSETSLLLPSWEKAKERGSPVRRIPYYMLIPIPCLFRPHFGSMLKKLTHAVFHMFSDVFLKEPLGCQVHAVLGY